MCNDHPDDVDMLLGTRYYGTVKFFVPEKRYGFLQCEALTATLKKQDIFVHGSQIDDLANFSPGAHAGHTQKSEKVFPVTEFESFCSRSAGAVYSFVLAKDEKNKPNAVELFLETPGLATNPARRENPPLEGVPKHQARLLTNATEAWPVRC
eukprot:6481021-Amphidinium_carterae.2